MEIIQENCSVDSNEKISNESECENEDDEDQEDKNDLWSIVGKVSSLICAFVIIKWINFEVWWYFGGGTFAMNRVP